MQDKVTNKVSQDNTAYHLHLMTFMIILSNNQYINKKH